MLNVVQAGGWVSLSTLIKVFIAQEGGRFYRVTIYKKDTE